MVSLPREFRASLDSYSGPLDLLLYLIKEEEIDVFNIPIARLVEQYQVYLELLKDVDPNACGEFLVMAARLMEVKSKLLLPREVIEEEDEELEDPRMELVRQLLEYKKFKERALLLERRLDLHRRRHNRPRLDLSLPGGEELAPLDLGNVSVWDLLTAFHRIQIALGQRGPHQVLIEDRPPEEYMRDVVARLSDAAERNAAFETLFAGARTRQELCGYFLAILQLAKEYRIVLEQEDEAGEIRIRLRDEQEVERLREEEIAFEKELRRLLDAGTSAAPRDALLDAPRDEERSLDEEDVLFDEDLLDDEEDDLPGDDGSPEGIRSET